jgi:hypothetical protein
MSLYGNPILSYFSGDLQIENANIVLKIIHETTAGISF